MNWYVIYVRGGKEEEVKELLQKYYLDAFCPKMEVLYRKQGESFLVNKLMFPNYIFVKSSLKHDEFHAKFVELRQKIQGIVKEMKFDNEGTSPLYQDEISFLEQILNDEYIMKHSIGKIINGKPCIIQGSLSGFEDSIRKIDRHKRRSLIEVSLHGELKQIYVSLEIVAKN